MLLSIIHTPVAIAATASVTTHPFLLNHMMASTCRLFRHLSWCFNLSTCSRQYPSFSQTIDSIHQISDALFVAVTVGPRIELAPPETSVRARMDWILAFRSFDTVLSRLLVGPELSQRTPGEEAEIRDPCCPACRRILTEDQLWSRYPCRFSVFSRNQREDTWGILSSMCWTADVPPNLRLLFLESSFNLDVSLVSRSRVALVHPREEIVSGCFV